MSYKLLLTRALLYISLKSEWGSSLSPDCFVSRGSISPCEYFLTRGSHGEALLAPRRTPELEDHPLSAVRDCLFNLFAATLHIGSRSSIRNLRTRHAVVTGIPLSHVSESHLWKYIKIFVHLQLRHCEQNYFIALSLFQLQMRAIAIKTKKCCTFRSAIPPNSSRYKYRRRDQLQHSICCPLNRTIIMKTTILAVLLLLAVASVVSGAPAESGKSRYGHETCLVVILQTLKC